MSISAGTRGILNRRPNLQFVAPKSGVTIPTPGAATSVPTPKEQRINQLIQGLENVAQAASAVEKMVAERAKGTVLQLDLSNPEDALVAQAAARHFPDRAVNKDGFIHVPAITFDMYSQCIQDMKGAGLLAGTKNETKSDNFKADKTDFGGQGQDQRPDVNRATVPFAPLDIPAFIAAGIPILFSMLFPLIDANNKKDIIGHTHPVVVPPAIVPLPTGPGLPVTP